MIRSQAPICELNKRFYSSKVANLEKIYTGPAGRNIFMLKLLSLTTSLTAVILEVRLLASDVATAMKLSASFISLFTFSTPFLAHFVLRKYVTEMYYDVANDSYTAVIYTIFATRKYVSEFLILFSIVETWPSLTCWLDKLTWQQINSLIEVNLSTDIVGKYGFKFFYTIFLENR